MALAYPTEKTSGMADHIARDAFLAALGDPDLELKIREREPSGLEEAAKIAQRYEVFKNAVEAQSSGRQRFSRQIVTEEDREGAGSSESLEARLVALERRAQGPTPASEQLHAGMKRDARDQPGV